MYSVLQKVGKVHIIGFCIRTNLHMGPIAAFSIVNTSKMTIINCAQAL